MRNFRQPGDVISVPAPYILTSGQGALVGALFGVAVFDAALSAPVELRVDGVVELTKATGEAWTVGAAIFWDNTNRRTTTTPTGNTRIGVATVAALAAATVGTVRLNGSF
jgi:predicted RecA/RadA family phage recombinase